MMRLKKLWITITLICCSLLFFASCKEARAVTGIVLNDYSAEEPLQMRMGKFSYEGYTVTVTYDNGDKETLALTEDMIPETEKLKFYQEGVRELVISYKGATTAVAIEVSRNEFSENVVLNNFTATYTGKPYTIEVEGDIPGGTNILYPQGNTFENAGTYDMTAILQCDGYASKTLSAKVVIERATYDVSGAQLYDKTVVYNKSSHALAVQGKVIETQKDTVLHDTVRLPEDVNVRYLITKIKDGRGFEIDESKQQAVEGNQAIDAGTYKVSAQFKGDMGNYNPIPDSVAYLTIERAAYDMSKIEFSDKTVTYSGQAYELKVAENSRLPLDVEISYQIQRIRNGAWDTVKNEPYKAGNTATAAGVYVVLASFNVIGKNADNYTASPTAKEARLTILRAEYEEIKDDLDPQWYDFEEGATYEISFDYELPQGVTPQFKLTNEYGEVIQGVMQKVEKTESVGNKVTVKTIYKYSFSVEEEGEYTCVISFTHNNENYEQIKWQVNTWIFIGSEA